MDANNCQLVNPQEVSCVAGAEIKFAATKNTQLRLQSTNDVYMCVTPAGTGPVAATRNGNACHKIMNSSTTSPIELYAPSGSIISVIPVAGGGAATVSLSELLPSF